MKKTKLKGIIDNKSEESDWRSDLIIELLSIRENQLTCILSTEQVEFMLTDVATARDAR